MFADDRALKEAVRQWVQKAESDLWLAALALKQGGASHKEHSRMKREASDLPKLASPAQRALAGAGITRLVQLTRMSETELAPLHGIGPNALKTLRLALQAKGLSFKAETK